MKARSLHILVLNQYFPPDTSATAKVAEEVVGALACHHRVTVLAGRPSYDPEEYHPYYLWRREVEGNLAVERVGSTGTHRRQMRGRIANYLSYLALAVPRALLIRADIILAMTDPPIVGIAGALVATLRRHPFVYNIQDLYPEMALAGRIIAPARWVEMWDWLHRWALRRASRVIVLGEDMRERIIAKGADSDRVVIVRDGTPIPLSLPSPENPVSRAIRCGFPFVVLHAGNLGFYGAWEVLLEASKLVAGEGVGFVFVGDGAAKTRIKGLAEGCGTVRFLPFRPSEQLPLVLAAGDMHVVTIRRGLEGVVVPSKLFGILAAGRPVLAVVPEGSDVARIVTRNGCGVVADPDDPGSVAAAIRGLVHDPEGLKRMGRRARAVAPEYERQKQLDRFVRVIESAARIDTSRQLRESI